MRCLLLFFRERRSTDLAIRDGSPDVALPVLGRGVIPRRRCDIFAPCALGGVIDRDAIRRLRARIVCGGANNVLASVEDGDRLADRDVLYAPDYVVNADGKIGRAHV